MDVIDTANPWTITHRPSLREVTRAVFPRAPRYRIEQDPRGTVVTLHWGDEVTGVHTDHVETYVVSAVDADGAPETVTRKCDTCAWGIRPEHRHVHGGVCFYCTHGTRPDVFHGSFAMAQKGFRKRSMDRARRERARMVDHNDHVTARCAFINAHPEVVDAHDRFLRLVRAEVRDNDPHRSHDPEFALLETASRIDRHVTELLNHTVLDAVQVRELVGGVDAAIARVSANPEKHVGAVGQTHTVTGVIERIIPVKSRYGYSTLFIIDGTGADTGAKAKFFSSAKWLDDYAEGDDLTFTGLVDDHEVDAYNGCKTTMFKRPKKV